MNTVDIAYDCEGVTCNGKLVVDGDSPRPGILIAHDWSGCNDFSLSIAKKICKQGYNAFAIDMYGEGQIGTTKEEKAQCIG